MFIEDVVWVELRELQKDGAAPGIQKRWECLLSLGKKQQEQIPRAGSSYFFSSFAIAIHRPISTRSQRAREPSWGTTMVSASRGIEKERIEIIFGGQNRIFNTQTKTGHLAIKANKHAKMQDLFFGSDLQATTAPQAKISSLCIYFSLFLGWLVKLNSILLN